MDPATRKSPEVMPDMTVPERGLSPVPYWIDVRTSEPAEELEAVPLMVTNNLPVVDGVMYTPLPSIPGVDVLPPEKGSFVATLPGVATAASEDLGG